jgi:hypothetical protein
LACDQTLLRVGSSATSMNVGWPPTLGIFHKAFSIAA